MSDVLTLGLPLVVDSEDSERYIVDVWKPSIQDVLDLWERYRSYRVLFADVVVDNFAVFRDIVLAKSTIVLLVYHGEEQVGVVYATDLRIPHGCVGHYFFWDRRTAGRQAVILRAAKWLFDELHIHRVKVSVPKHAFAALHRILKMGLRLEGVEREAMLYEGRWSDMLHFGILVEELTSEALASGKLARTEAEQDWFGLLRNDEVLMEKVVSRRAP